MNGVPVPPKAKSTAPFEPSTGDARNGLRPLALRGAWPLNRCQRYSTSTGPFEKRPLKYARCGVTDGGTAGLAPIAVYMMKSLPASTRLSPNTYSESNRCSPDVVAPHATNRVHSNTPVPRSTRADILIG